MRMAGDGAMRSSMVTSGTRFLATESRLSTKNHCFLILPIQLKMADRFLCNASVGVSGVGRWGLSFPIRILVV